MAHIWYFKSLPNKIGYLLGLPSKKLDAVIYYERYIVVQPGIMSEKGIAELDMLTEEEYLDIVDALPADNQHLRNTVTVLSVSAWVPRRFRCCWNV